MFEDDERMRKQQRIFDLITELQSSVSPIGDWRITKYQEYILAGLEPPYDINELNQNRQRVRDEINQLREELK